jgi:phosphotriesterase-related protein
MPSLITTLGDFKKEELGLILPHEHVFVDLGPVEEENWRGAFADDVSTVMVPYLEEAREAGVAALVECTPVGVGRRADIVKAVSAASGLPVVIPTGIYREPWVPQWARDAGETALRDWMIKELSEGIGGVNIPAGWIKLSAGDDGLAEVERKILRAAAQAGVATNAVIGSHTVRGRVVLDQLEVIEESGYTAEHFIWIHAQLEPDFDLQLEAARRGAWLEYDAIGSDWCEDAYFLEHIPRLLDAGYGHRLLLSQDRGWYDPSKPRGGEQKPYTYLIDTFIPKMWAAGIDMATIQSLTIDNPFMAFAR